MWHVEDSQEVSNLISSFLGRWYSFHLDLLKKSINSCGFCARHLSCTSHFWRAAIVLLCVVEEARDSSEDVLAIHVGCPLGPLLTFLLCGLYPFPVGCILSTFYHPVYECVFLVAVTAYVRRSNPNSV